MTRGSTIRDRSKFKRVGFGFAPWLGPWCRMIANMQRETREFRIRRCEMHQLYRRRTGAPARGSTPARRDSRLNMRSLASDAESSSAEHSGSARRASAILQRKVPRRRWFITRKRWTQKGPRVESCGGGILKYYSNKHKCYIC